MPSRRVIRTAEQFWAAAGNSTSFPRDFETAIAWALPIAVIRLPRLRVRAVECCLEQRQIPYIPQPQDRRLHGCIYAFAGNGLLFVDGADAPNEVRFTLAHEVAHFLLDYYFPRQVALNRFGACITGVLDGVRSATVGERVDSVLANTPIGVYKHFMHRREGDYADTHTAAAEIEADELALELLAPADSVRHWLRKSLKNKSYSEKQKRVCVVLSRRFGLPTPIATGYSARLSRIWFNPGNIRDWLGMD